VRLTGWPLFAVEREAVKVLMMGLSAKAVFAIKRRTYMNSTPVLFFIVL
jgi:hypothetical protein